ncbi:winged helix DNA-binding domain-containing protein [Rhodococcus sp. SJ-3]|uniref:winged helix DNA-binding domain-containing protein n=1 Tax=Rhodococcus sp. SJ-3 TaxID=3454628 RepID=UPI003F78C326
MMLRTVDVGERRARLAARHRIAPAYRAADAVEAARSMVCLHGTDPATVYLSTWSRVTDFSAAELDAALYRDRTLVKHLAMRRTVFVFPRAALAAAQAGASNRVAAAQRRSVIKDAERAGLHRDGAQWLDDATAGVLAALAGGREATASELRSELPVLDASIDYGVGKSWGGKVSFAPRVMTVLSASGQVLRASNNGSWRISRPNWVRTASWLGEEIEPRSESEGLRDLVAMWLGAFGPGTEADIKWWLGSTIKAVRAALTELAAVEVDLDGRVGYLLPDDVDPAPSAEPWGALLPSLDPTTMGWFEREWYLGPYKQQLFDTSGNAGPTAWWDGRVVGTWWQSDDGAVRLHMLEDAGKEASAFLTAEAARLEEWLEGVRVLPRFPSPLAKALAAG